MKLKRHINFLNESNSETFDFQFEAGIWCDQCEGEGMDEEGFPCHCDGITEDVWTYTYKPGEGVVSKHVIHIDDFEEIEFIENFINKNKNLSISEMADALIMMTLNDEIESFSAGVEGIKMIGDFKDLLSDKVRNYVRSLDTTSKYDL